MNRFHHLLRILVIGLFLGASAICSATEPLVDLLTVDGQQGPFFPDKCCWVDLPRTERLRAAKMAEMCSAIGGPVGNFRLADGKIWLDGLRRCGGNMPLEEVYPELDQPAFASWLNGMFTAKSGFVCHSRHNGFLEYFYRTTLRLRVENGVVTNLQRQENDLVACRTDIEK